MTKPFQAEVEELYIGHPDSRTVAIVRALCERIHREAQEEMRERCAVQVETNNVCGISNQIRAIPISTGEGE